MWIVCDFNVSTNKINSIIRRDSRPLLLFASLAAIRSTKMVGWFRNNAAIRVKLRVVVGF